MRRWGSSSLLVAAAWIQASCTRTESPPRSSKPEPVRITQFYATAPKLSRGDKELLCYGVENAKTVWLSPPRQELTASVSRCVEVNPSSATTYTLSAEGATGQPATQEVNVDVGPPRARILEVKVSTLELKRGDQLSICYRVENAKSVEIQPIHFRSGPRPDACTMTSPRETTTYVVSAVGADGGKDEERVTVKVR
jgi:hypothetical protein